MSEYAIPLARTRRPEPRGGRASELGSTRSSPGPAHRAQRRAGRSRGSSLSERILVVLIAAASVAALATAVLILAPSLLRISRYEITGALSMKREEVLSAALIHGSEYFLAVDPERIRANLLADPRILDAQVHRRFPNALAISVRERVPVVAVLAELGGRSTAISIDAQGVAFALADPAGLGSLPVLSGLRFEDFRLGTRLPESLTPILSALGEIELHDAALLSAFSEIRIVKPSYGEPELLLYPIQHRIPVRAGAALNAQSLRSMILVLDVLGSRPFAGLVEEIDFRTGTV
ncbi:MAG TPA: FtsQ-type POTRA domain-containing protein, partial [Rectinemataceae bacterium]|nr:FtsQ-type POTRA domain-containing protein [Rectinemataceae bacterium]